MKIIQTKNKAEIFENLKNSEIYVQNVGMFIDIDYMQIPIYKFTSYLMIYCKSGNVLFRNNGTEKMLESGYIKIIPPDTYCDFAYMPDNNNEYCYIHFSGILADKLTECIFTEGNTIYIGNRPDVYNYFEEIEKSFSLLPNDHLSRTVLLKNLFYILLKTQDLKYVKNMQTTSIVSNSIIYIQNNYSTKITVDYLAKKCSLSRYYYMRLFKELTGSSVSEYIIQIRLEKAKELLMNTNYTISEVARAIGYDNALYFSRLFKARTTLSPSEYKKRQWSHK